MNNITKYAPLSSMIMMVIGLFLFLFSDTFLGIYIFTAGAIILGLIRFVALVRSRNGKAVTRLPQIHLFSVAALLAAAYLMYDGSNSWSVMLLVSAVVEVYVSYRQK